jgi:prevent-host-death family protein
MTSMSAKDAKNGFGLLLDTARAEPVTIEKHGRAVVVVLSVEEYERLRDNAPASEDQKERKLAKEEKKKKKAKVVFSSV